MLIISSIEDLLKAEFTFQKCQSNFPSALVQKVQVFGKFRINWLKKFDFRLIFLTSPERSRSSQNSWFWVPNLNKWSRTSRSDVLTEGDARDLRQDRRGRHRRHWRSSRVRSRPWPGWWFNCKKLVLRTTWILAWKKWTIQYVLFRPKLKCFFKEIF